jgi:hypothetical protein
MTCAQDSTDPQAQEYELELVSMYLELPLARVHGLALRLGPEIQGIRKGILTVDPNTCGLDGWGDRAGCTRIALREIAFTATRMTTTDPSGRGRVLHRVESPEFADESANLIEYRDAGLWYAVYEQEKGGTLVIPLFAARLFSPFSLGPNVVP